MLEVCIIMNNVEKANRGFTFFYSIKIRAPKLNYKSFEDLPMSMSKDIHSPYIGHNSAVKLRCGGQEHY